MLFFPKTHTPSVMVRKTSEKSRLGTFYRILACIFKIVKVLKYEERLTKETRHLNAVCLLDWILEEKEDINGKAGEIQRKYRIKKKQDDISVLAWTLSSCVNLDITLLL